jgi:hypothetical protein
LTNDYLTGCSLLHAAVTSIRWNDLDFDLRRSIRTLWVGRALSKGSEAMRLTRRSLIVGLILNSRSGG